MAMRRRSGPTAPALRLALLALLALGAAGARAADAGACDGRQAAGYRVLATAGERPIAV